MNKLINNTLTLTLLPLAMACLPAVSSADTLDEILAAISSGKAGLEMRARSEWVDDSARKEANAETLRTVLNYRTGEYQGVSAFLEFENIANLGRTHYNNGTAGASATQKTFAVIGDPTVAQINQSYVEGYGLRLGRQKIIIDNARFIGDVGWRQNDQTFNGVSYTNKVSLPATQFMLAYVSRVNAPSGVTRAVQAPMGSIHYGKVFADGGFGVTAYAMAVEEKATLASLNPQISPATSFQHSGLRVEGSLGNAQYEVAYARQGSYADSTATADANYYDLQLGYKFGTVGCKLEHEVLQPGFKTPLATLHAFNGWADRFLTTPTDGLRDTNLKLQTRALGLNLALALHDFRTDRNDRALGSEVDFSVAKPITRNLNVLLKGAAYHAEDTRQILVNKTSNGIVSADVRNSNLRKVWVQLAYKF